MNHPWEYLKNKKRGEIIYKINDFKDMIVDSLDKYELVYSQEYSIELAYNSEQYVEIYEIKT